MVVIIKNVYEEDFTQNVLKSDKPVVVDFFAEWCAPCKMLSPVMEELADENSDFVFYKSNVDKNPKLAEAYGINAIPAILIFNEGERVDTMVGYNSKEEMQKLIDRAR